MTESDRVYAAYCARIAQRARSEHGHCELRAEDARHRRIAITALKQVFPFVYPDPGSARWIAGSTRAYMKGANLLIEPVYYRARCELIDKHEQVLHEEEDRRGSMKIVATTWTVVQRRTFRLKMPIGLTRGTDMYPHLLDEIARDDAYHRVKTHWPAPGGRVWKLIEVVKL